MDADTSAGMDAEETNGEPLRRCLICRELKGLSDFRSDAVIGVREYCVTCDTIQRAHTKAHLAVMFDWTEPNPPVSFLLNGVGFGERWRDYAIEYLYSSAYAAMTQRVIFAPWRYRGSMAPMLDDGKTPLVWRIRLFHAERRGYAEGWWNPHIEQWDWSLCRTDPDMPATEWNEWRAAMREANGAGRPRGSALIYLSSLSAFLARCREAVSERGWPEAAQGMDAITRKQTLQRVRAGCITQAQLGEILGCGHRTITLALARFKESDHLEWHDLQRWLAEWSHESSREF